MDHIYEPLRSWGYIGVIGALDGTHPNTSSPTWWPVVPRWATTTPWKSYSAVLGRWDTALGSSSKSLYPLQGFNLIGLGYLRASCAHTYIGLRAAALIFTSTSPGANCVDTGTFLCSSSPTLGAPLRTSTQARWWVGIPGSSVWTEGSI